MRFIKKEDIESYRYAIAKICFLDIYNEYELISDIPKSNCIIVKDKNYTYSIISIFKPPTLKIEEEYPVVCFYQKGHAPRSGKRDNMNFLVRLLESEFNKHYDASFEKAILHPDDFVNGLKTQYLTLIKGILYNDDIFNQPDVSRYKYYSKEKVDSNRFNVVDGRISFADPNTFNDPFDVNCFFANSTDISGLFRIFCVAPDSKEILMWSYYATNHQGYCFEYKDKDILKAIMNEKRACLCIVGNVTYSDIRPNQKSRLNRISYSEIDFYIKSAFTKYSEWSHEKEYRYVMLLNDFSDAKDKYFEYDIPLQNVFQGCALPLNTVSDSKGNVYTPTQVNKDSKFYQLY